MTQMIEEIVDEGLRYGKCRCVKCSKIMNLNATETCMDCRRTKCVQCGTEFIAMHKRAGAKICTHCNMKAKSRSRTYGQIF